MRKDAIKYVSENGYSGLLYDYHEFYGEEFYQMSIRDNDGKEVLHAYNATPKSFEELKEAIEWFERKKMK